MAPPKPSRLLPGSPAFETGYLFDDPLGNTIIADQRGVTRPQGQSPDIGAFESRGFIVTAVNGTQSAQTGSPFSNLTITVTGLDTGLTGSNLAGGIVVFTAPSTGATAILGAAAPLDSTGSTSVAATANSIVGTEIITASAGPSDLVQSALFHLTNLPSQPSVLSISGNNSTIAGSTYTLNLSSQFPAADLGDGIESWTITWGDGALLRSSPEIHTSRIRLLRLTSLLRRERRPRYPQPRVIWAGLMQAQNTIQVAVATAPITVTSGAAASPSPVTGNSTQLTVAATDSAGGADLTYTWAAATSPAGVQLPSFSTNGSNSASTTTATFYAAGAYNFVVTINDTTGDSISSAVKILVVQTPTSVKVTPEPNNARGKREQPLWSVQLNTTSSQCL